jgi:hypothetical protein
MTSTEKNRTCNCSSEQPTSTYRSFALFPVWETIHLNYFRRQLKRVAKFVGWSKRAKELRMTKMFNKIITKVVKQKVERRVAKQSHGVLRRVREIIVLPQ